METQEAALQIFHDLISSIIQCSEGCISQNGGMSGREQRTKLTGLEFDLLIFPIS